MRGVIWSPEPRGASGETDRPITTVKPRDIMKRTITLLTALLLVVGLAAGPAMAKGQGNGKDDNNATSLGKVALDTEVGWLAGDGLPDGEFITAEKQGIVLGLRAHQRHTGLLGVTGTMGDRVAVYEAPTGLSSGDNNGTWNYDWHVDVSDAKGNAKGKTLADYRLTLEQDFTSESLFGVLGADPVELSLGDFAACADAVLTATRCQQSWNPGFGNADYDPNAEGTYDLRLVLTPETFNGPPIAVAIQVHVTDA